MFAYQGNVKLSQSEISYNFHEPLGAIRERSFCRPCIGVDVKEFNFIVECTVSTNRKNFVIDIAKRSCVVIVGCIRMIDITFPIETFNMLE